MVRGPFTNAEAQVLLVPLGQVQRPEDPVKE